MFPLVFIVISMSAAAVAESRSDPSDDDRLRRRLVLQDERLSREEARFETIKEDAYRRIDILKEAGTEARRLLNVHISDTMTGQWRGKDRFRCGESHQEIGHVAVCDGVVDCKNGVDELNETCVNPVVVGSIWKGYTVYNHCNGDSIHRLTVKILNAVRPHWFSAFVQIRAEAHVYRVIDDAVIERRHSIYGAYSFGSRVLFVHSPRTLTSRLVVLAQFDGTSTTRCYGYEVRQVTMETCAEYRFFRVE